MTGRRMVIVASMVAVTGCGTLTQTPQTPNTATAELKDADGKVVGTAKLTQVSDGVRIVLETRGLPAGPRAVHIHEVGKCDPPEFTTAGAHFNPSGKKHGLLNPDGPHDGDLPNMTVAPDGTGRLETLNNRISLARIASSGSDGDGSALIIHAGPDDFKTDPAGNSGARIACGVIAKTK